MAEATAHAGNRLALAGAIWYLLEIPLVLPFVADRSPSPAKSAEIVAYYSTQHPKLLVGLATASVVLIGRIAFAAGARASLQRTAGVRALADLAVGAMILSVVLEVGSTALQAAAGRMAAGGGDPAGVVALHYAFGTVGFASVQATAAAIAATALAQVISGQFPRWLGWLGLLAGVAGIASSGILTATGVDPQAAPYLTVCILGFWVWMVATGVILFRRTPGRRSSQPESA